jgi:hypothetical protein
MRKAKKTMPGFRLNYIPAAAGLAGLSHARYPYPWIRYVGAGIDIANCLYLQEFRQGGT